MGRRENFGRKYLERFMINDGLESFDWRRLVLAIKGTLTRKKCVK
jgi:hypothetical protein